MNRIPERRRPLFVLAASLAVLLVVAGGVLLIGRLTPTPTPTTAPTSSATGSPSADPSTPALRIPLRVGARDLGTLRLLGRSDVAEQEAQLLPVGVGRALGRWRRFCRVEGAGSTGPHFVEVFDRLAECIGALKPIVPALLPTCGRPPERERRCLRPAP